MIRIATLQYKIEEMDWDAYVKKITSIMENAKQENIQLIILPEYAGVEIGGKHNNDKELFAAIQPLLSQYLDFYKNLAFQYNLFIQPGTIPVKTHTGKYVNRAYFFGPNNIFGYQDKLQLVEFEKATEIIEPGKDQILFDTALGKIGIAICYDSEFPEIVRQLTKAGAELILIPSYTNSLAGYHRVELSCRARAIENQCYCVVSYSVGFVNSGNELQEQVFGRAAVFSPADISFPDNGIIKQGALNKEELVIANINLQKISFIREHGQVRNFEDAKRFNLDTQLSFQTKTL